VSDPSAGPAPRGFTVFFTGLSGAGKSTLARLLAQRLRDRGRDDVTVLDGDEVRRRLSPDLGFTREDRERHLMRLAAEARAITAGGGIAVCAPIAPYQEARRRARSTIGEAGGFILVHLSTPLAVCEERDPKGLYSRARAGAIPHFTGVSDPYEVPPDADVTIDTSRVSADDGVAAIMHRLECSGLLARSR
jgi:sulfate adenylyltransferase